jgi:hypothetical protein
MLMALRILRDPTLPAPVPKHVRSILHSHDMPSSRQRVSLKGVGSEEHGLEGFGL